MKRNLSAPKKRTTFYLETELTKKFKVICTREQESMSSKFEKWMRDYIIKHEPGNPQLRLDKISQTKITKECSHPSCKKTAVYEVWSKEKNLHAYLCEGHKERDKKLLKRWCRL